MSTAQLHRSWRILFFPLILALNLLAAVPGYSASAELERYRAELIARGEILDIDKLAPKRTGNEPDGDEPLEKGVKAMQHGVSALKTGHLTTEYTTNGMQRILRRTHTNNLTQAQRAPLWQQAATELETRHADLRLLSQALQDPPREKGSEYRDFINRTQSNSRLRREVGQFLQAAAFIDIYARRTNQAMAAQLALLDLTDLHREEWWLPDQHLRNAICRHALDATWYGLETRLWNESALQQLQQRWENISLLTNVFQSLVYERAFGVFAFQLARTDPARVRREFPDPATTVSERSFRTWYYSSGIDDDELYYLKSRQTSLDLWRQTLKSPDWATALQEFETLESEWNRVHWENIKTRRYRLSFIMDWLKASTIYYSVSTETIRQQTIIAIALERHRLKHGHYPDALSKLIPAYLAQIPQDPMDGRPMLYHRGKDGTFTLWSVGLDDYDDGGDPTMPDPQKQNFPQDSNDMVWPRLDPIDLPPKP